MGRIDCTPTFLSLGNNVKWIHRRVLSLLEYKEIIIQENCIAVLNSVVGWRDQEMRSRLKVFYKTKITRVSSEYCANQCWTEGRSSTAVAEDLRPTATATVAEV